VRRDGEVLDDGWDGEMEWDGQKMETEMEKRQLRLGQGQEWLPAGQKARCRDEEEDT
jgi:hypothetical protein